MDELDRLKEMAGINEAGQSGLNLIIELNYALSGIGFLGKDLRETKEQLEKDGGQKIARRLQEAMDLVKQIQEQKMYANTHNNPEWAAKEWEVLPAKK